MNNNSQKISNVEENVLFGTVGAFLFSLVGGVLYYILYQFGFIAGISGLAGVVCAIKGYSFFSKKESLRGVVISVICAAVVLIIAWYLCLTNDVYLAYQEWYAAGEIDFTLTFFESAQIAYLFLADVPAYFGDLAISLLLAAVGCGSYVANMIKKAKGESAAPIAPIGASEAEADNSTSSENTSDVEADNSTAPEITSDVEADNSTASDVESKEN